MKIYLVGGAVRDALLQLPVIDRDWVVVGATAQEFLQSGFQPVGRDFPVFLHPETREEYALARTERKSGQGYSGFICYSAPDVTLQQDLLRRDLTINAIAQDQEGNYIDPYQGREDLRRRLLRHISPAFTEDPLRVLRVARFAARFALLGFKIAPETLTLMKQIAHSGELATLAPERIWAETEKALREPCPQIFFQTLRNCDALKPVFPELDQLFGVPAPEKWHPEIDTGIHTLMTLRVAAQLSSETEVRFAALCHDIGKGLTSKAIWPRHPNHGVAGLSLIETLCKRLRIPNAIRDLALLVAEYHDLVHICDHQSAKVLLQLFDAIDVWRRPHRLIQLVQASEADYRGRSGWEDYPYLQGEYLKSACAVVKGVDNQSVLDDGFPGAEIKKELYRRRLAALTAWQKG